MPAPRADFVCLSAKCRKGGEAPIYELPTTATRCAVCGSKRIQRLFNKVQISTVGHRVRRFIDRRLEPAFAQHAKVKDSAKKFTRDAEAAMDRAFEGAPPKTREAMAAAKAGIVGKPVPAAAALASIDPVARADTRALVYPALTNRRVVPVWQR